MKLQLTKDKTIEVNIPGLGGGGKGKSSTDIVGVELFSSCEDGCPAVRLLRKKNSWRLAAFGYAKPPEGDLPERWEDTPHQPVWEMPREFQAPSAAIAVNSDMSSFGQASAEAIVQEMVHGPVHTEGAAQEPAAKKRFGIKPRAPVPPKVAEAAQGGGGKEQRTPDFPEAGKPVSENGRRFAVRPSAETGFHFSASIPEFQALWLGRLLPEGRRPTATSIQLANSALMACVLAQPEFAESGGNMLAMFVRDASLYVAGYKGGMPVLWRRCPGDCGYRAMRGTVEKTLGIGGDLVDSVLEESLIDPRPALEPFLHPVLEQLEIARAYLTGKHSMKVDKVVLLGLPCGVAHWRRYVEESLKIGLSAPDPFEGIQLDKGVEVASPHRHLVALGAALAASEAES